MTMLEVLNSSLRVFSSRSSGYVEHFSPSVRLSENHFYFIVMIPRVLASLSGSPSTVHIVVRNDSLTRM